MKNEGPPATQVGYRSHEDAPLFRSRRDDPSIVPDRVSAAVEGYFRIPPVWIGEAPHPTEAATLNPAVHHSVVLRRTLKSGVEVLVQRDGTFLFDFSTWPLAPLTIILGFIIPHPSEPYIASPEHVRAAEIAESIAVFRAQVMNAHQACLATSEWIVRGRGGAMGFPVTAWNTHKAISFETPPAYCVDPEDMHATARNSYNMVAGRTPAEAPYRQTIELDVVSYSLDILDKLLLRNERSVIDLVEGAYISACRSREKRFGESVTIGWTVCEQLVTLAWRKLLEDAKSESVNLPERMTKRRIDKLTGRDYSASVMVEFLELSGRIDLKLYNLLEKTRKARNAWAHEMKAPGEEELYSCRDAISALFAQVLGIRLWLNGTGRGGVPEWPIWFWDQELARKTAKLS